MVKSPLIAISSLLVIAVAALADGPREEYQNKAAIRTLSKNVLDEATQLTAAFDAFVENNPRYWVQNPQNRKDEMKAIFEVRRFVTSAQTFDNLVNPIVSTGTWWMPAPTTYRIDSTYYSLPKAFRVFSGDHASLIQIIANIMNGDRHRDFCEHTKIEQTYNQLISLNQKMDQLKAWVNEIDGPSGPGNPGGPGRPNGPGYPPGNPNGPGRPGGPNGPGFPGGPGRPNPGPTFELIEMPKNAADGSRGWYCIGGNKCATEGARIAPPTVPNKDMLDFDLDSMLPRGAKVVQVSVQANARVGDSKNGYLYAYVIYPKRGNASITLKGVSSLGFNFGDGVSIGKNSMIAAFDAPAETSGSGTLRLHASGNNEVVVEKVTVKYTR
ncbi:MAG: hypothetical protein AB7P04_16060 [Bacteriovoracia bacterium]